MEVKFLYVPYNLGKFYNHRLCHPIYNSYRTQIHRVFRLFETNFQKIEVTQLCIYRRYPQLPLSFVRIVVHQYCHKDTMKNRLEQLNLLLVSTRKRMVVCQFLLLNPYVLAILSSYDNKFYFVNPPICIDAFFNKKASLFAKSLITFTSLNPS